MEEFEKLIKDKACGNTLRKNLQDSLVKGKEGKEEKDEVELTKKEFVKEHKKLVKVLKTGSKKEQEKEAEDQEEELKNEIKKANTSGQIYGDPVGTIKVWNGIKYQKQGSGKWKPVTEGSLIGPEKLKQVETEFNKEFAGKYKDVKFIFYTTSSKGKYTKTPLVFYTPLEGATKESRDAQRNEVKPGLEKIFKKLGIELDIAVNKSYGSLTIKPKEFKPAEESKQPEITEAYVKDIMSSIQDDDTHAYPTTKEILKEMKKKGVDISDPKIKEQVKQHRWSIKWDIDHMV